MNAAAATWDFLPLLGIAPVLGRGFTESDLRESTGVAVLSYAFWAREYARSPHVLGRPIALTGMAGTNTVVIVGVLPESFRFPIPDSKQTPPLFPQAQPDVIRLMTDPRESMQVIGRLAASATYDAASSELTDMFEQEAVAYFSPSTIARVTSVTVAGLQSRLSGSAATRSWLLMAAVGCVLLVVCANIANLLLARAFSRETELAVRAALGASGTRLARLVLTESVVLAATGAIGGLFVAYFASGLLQSMLADRVSYVGAIGLDWRVLAFTCAIAIATGVASGAVSLVSTRFVALSSRVRSGMHVTGRARMRSVLLAAEVAVTFVLTLTAALLTHTLWNLHRADRGFNQDRVVTLSVMPNMAGTIRELQYTESDFFARVTERIGAMPELESVAAASTVPFAGGAMAMPGVAVVGQPPPANETSVASVAAVTPRYFTTIGTRVIGREFDGRDLDGRERVAIVNESFRAAFASGTDLIDRQMRFRQFTFRIVGVAEDVPDASLRTPAKPFVYLPLAQVPGTPFAFGALTLLARTRTADSGGVLPAMREAVWSLGDDIVIDKVATMNDRLSASLKSDRDNALMFGSLAAIALVVAAAGVYGVVAYSVARRTREMGVRIALGAGSSQVINAIVSESARPIAIGLVIGIAGAVLAARGVANLLFGTTPLDIWSFAFTAIVLGTTGLGAAWIPARRATRVDPVAALKAE